MQLNLKNETLKKIGRKNKREKRTQRKREKDEEETGTHMKQINIYLKDVDVLA